MSDITKDAMYWANVGDNRVGPLMRELIEALAESDDPHFVRQISRRIQLLSSSLNSMAHKMAKSHDRESCPLCQKGSPL